MQRARIGLLATLLVCLLMNLHQWQRPNLADFQVYDAASELVHQHDSIDMYDGADTGVLFGLRFVAPASPLGRAAQKIGAGEIRLYIYPPLLADMVLPLTYVSAHEAGQLWLAFNLVCLFATAALLAVMLGVRIVSLGGAAILVGLFAMYATGMCLIWGQVTILLLLLWAAGMACYLRGWKVASALLFALATAIKLTPLLVLVPFLLWREWTWVRAYLLGTLACFALMAAVNSPASLTDYFFHVMPSMSGGGVPDFENKSLLSCAQLLYVTLHHGIWKPVTMAVPHTLVAAAKAVSLLLLLAALALVARVGRTMQLADRRMCLALFALLSVCVAPISWKHAYVAAFLPLCLLWAEAFRSRASTWMLLALTFCSIELGSFFFDDVIAKVAHGPLFGILCFVAPVTGVVLVLSRLSVMRRPAYA